MPGLFSSKRRGSSAQPPVDRSTAANATAAANLAFLPRKTSNASLSSAAAAAALRSIATSPEPVGNIQTKRMSRRGSVSSVGSGSVAGSVRPGMQRTNSITSMTDRTFRSPSPAGRSNSLLSVTSDVPTVPRIPRHIGPPPRASSVEPQRRVLSPTPTRGARNLSADRASMPPPVSTRSGKRLSDVHEVAERSEATTGASKTRPMVRTAANGQRMVRVSQPASLNASTAYEGPPALSYEAADAVMVFDPNTRTFVPQPRAKPKAPVKQAPPAAKPSPLPPGTYDPATRSIVPAPPATVAAVAAATARPAAQPLEPPRRNPARLSQSSPTPASPTTPPRPLYRQPSVVAEDPAGEEAGETRQLSKSKLVPTGGLIQTSAGPAKAYVATAPAKSALDIPSRSPSVSTRGRLSPSPQRAARFSASPVIDAIRHDPPARDLSPVKSALKHSPAPSVRASSPLVPLSPTVTKTAALDVSDTASQDGSAKKRRSVRVSFEEQPQEIDAASAAASPKALLSDRSILDDPDADDELMRPRPALPSFGSVRNNKAGPDVAEKVTEMAPDRQQTEPPLTRFRAGLFNDDSDGSDYSSSPVAASKKPTAMGGTEVDAVPAISVQPATPGTESDNVFNATPRSMPASLDAGLDDAHQAEVTSAGAASATVAALKADDDGSAPTDAPPNPEDSDEVAEFSDAAEDLSELDDGGFISLNAVAVSPVAKKPIITGLSDEAPATPAAEAGVSDEDGLSSGDWSKATAYWSKLSRQQREQIEREHLSDDDVPSPPAGPRIKKKTSAKKISTAAPTASAQEASAPMQPSAVNAAARAQQPEMRKSLRQDVSPARPENEVHMRRSLRSGGMMAASLRDGGPSSKTSQRTPASARPVTETRLSNSGLPAAAVGAALLHREQPEAAKPRAPATSTSSAIVSSKKQSALPPMSIPPTNIGNQKSSPALTSRLQKELAGDSDSDSSFKKARRGSASVTDSQGRYSMKRSMRDSSVNRPASVNVRATSPTPARGKDSFSVRSLSPSGGSLFGRNRGEGLRASLRASSVEPASTRANGNGAPSLRGIGQSRGGSSIGSRFSSRNGKAAGPSIGAKFKSRFASNSDDSDDEYQPQQKRSLFKSRFTNSDDEDDDVFIPADLTPVRGIPRSHGQTDGDSTDLSDEEASARVEQEELERRKASRNRERQSAPGVPDSADIDKAMASARQERASASHSDFDRAMVAARKKLGIAEPSSTSASADQGALLQRGSLRNSTTKSMDMTPSSPRLARPMSALGGFTAQQPSGTSEASPVDQSTPEKKRRGLFGSLVRRRQNSTVSVSNPSSPAPSPGLDTLFTPPAAAEPAMNGLDETQTRPNGRMRRGDSALSTATAPVYMSADASNGDTIPPVPAVPSSLLSADGPTSGWARRHRPTTSDGNVPAVRSSSVVQFDVNDEQDDTVKGANIYSRRTGKKKKFGMLRKAFGLDD